MRVESVQMPTITYSAEQCISQIFHRIVSAIQAVSSAILSLISRLWEAPLDFDYKRICQGSQIGCDGLCDSDQVRQVCERLNEQRPAGIFFNEGLIEPNITGGACSSMSLELLDQCLQRSEAIKANPLLELRNIGAQFSSCSEVLRTRQAAFNAISHHPHEASADFKRDKMASMLKFHRRHIVSSSEEVDLTQQSSAEKLNRVFCNLPRGVFAVRAIDPIDNHKGEVKGHTMVLINESWGRFFYDPNYGICQLGDRGHLAVSGFLQQVNRDFNVPNMRFYEVR